MIHSYHCRHHPYPAEVPMHSSHFLSLHKRMKQTEESKQTKGSCRDHHDLFAHQVNVISSRQKCIDRVTQQHHVRYQIIKCSSPALAATTTKHHKRKNNPRNIMCHTILNSFYESLLLPLFLAASFLVSSRTCCATSASIFRLSSDLHRRPDCPHLMESCRCCSSTS